LANLVADSRGGDANFLGGQFKTGVAGNGIKSADRAKWGRRRNFMDEFNSSLAENYDFDCLT
jgi:hypothetical protein